MSLLNTFEDAELLPCSFEFHNFQDQIGEVKIHCQIIKMQNSLFLWIGDYNEQNMQDLALAFTMQNKPTMSTKIMGPIFDEISKNLASRLSKKSGYPVYVSFNLSVNNILLPGIEKRIYEEFKKFPKLMTM